MCTPYTKAHQKLNTKPDTPTNHTVHTARFTKSTRTAATLGPLALATCHPSLQFQQNLCRHCKRAARVPCVVWYVRKHASCMQAGTLVAAPVQHYHAPVPAGPASAARVQHRACMHNDATPGTCNCSYKLLQPGTSTSTWNNASDHNTKVCHKCYCANCVYRCALMQVM